MPFDGKGMEIQLDTLDKIDRVIDLLDRPEKWCKGVLKSSDGRLCVLGAVLEAHADKVLKVPLLAAIEQVTGRSYPRIETFNDHRTTTHAVVMQVLRQARRNILAGEHLAPARTVAPGLWRRFAALF
ncbi:MAG: hypothetical protein ACLQJR_01635 [Stellaceae bacterium]